MKREDLVKICAVALGTATLTVATFSAGPGTAGNEGESLPATIAKPKLASHGVELTLASAEGVAGRAGDRPVLELTAVNLTKATANVSVDVVMTTMGPADITSRVVRAPSMLWQQPQLLTLKPGETLVKKLTAGVELPKDNVVSVWLREHIENSPAAGGSSAVPAQLTAWAAPGVLMTTISTRAPLASPTLAAVR